MSDSRPSSPAVPADPAPDLVARLRAAGCVFAEEEARLLASAARTPAELDAMVDRRSAGLPLEHVVGWAEFGGLRVAVDPGVFVPRVRTEFLVAQAAALARAAIVRARAHDGAPPRTPAQPPDGARVGRTETQADEDAGTSSAAAMVVVDLCCGTGAVGAALAAELNRKAPGRTSPGRVEVHAADVDAAAVRCARSNLAAAGGTVYEGDLFAPLPAALRGRVGVLLANTPYVPTGEIPLLPAEARLHEAPVALDGGPDGLDVQRRVAAEAARWLAPGGHLLVEASERQAPRTAEMFAAHGLEPHVAASEEHAATVVVGTRPAGSPSGAG